MKTAQILPGLSGLALIARGHKPGGDPLKNSRKLTAEGHATLYNAGAFKIPMTGLHVIPPIPGVIALAAQMAGKGARDSFLHSIKHIRESVVMLRAGMDLTRKISAVIQQDTRLIVSGVRHATAFGRRMAGASLHKIRNAINNTFTYSAEGFHSTRKAGDRLAQGSLATAGAINQGSHMLV